MFKRPPVIAGALLALFAAFVFTSPPAYANERGTHQHHSHPQAQQGRESRIHGTRSSARSTVDWQWLYGRWVIKFNWAETRQMARGTDYCVTIAGLASLAWPAMGVLLAACSVIWVVANGAKDLGKCVKVTIPISLVNPIVGTWSCPT